MRKLDYFNWQELTNYGYDIFKNEISDFSTTKNVKNPFGGRDKTPSCRIKETANGVWVLYVYNEGGEYYNAIKFLERKYGFDYKTAINYIKNNYNLNVAPVNSFQGVVKKPKPSSLKFKFNIIPFKNSHKQYFGYQGITEEFLNEKMDIYAIDKFAINDIVTSLSNNQFGFVYLYKNNEGRLLKNKGKILRLRVAKKNKWRTNLSPISFFYTYKIKDNPIVFVTKSNKDCIPLELLNIPAIAVMSENSFNIITGLKKLQKKYPNTKFIINMGSDAQGKETSLKICKELNLLSFNTPLNTLHNNINDNWSYMTNFGLESFKNLLKQNNLWQH